MSDDLEAKYQDLKKIAARACAEPGDEHVRCFKTLTHKFVSLIVGYIWIKIPIKKRESSEHSANWGMRLTLAREDPCSELWQKDSVEHLINSLFVTRKPTVTGPVDPTSIPAPEQEQPENNAIAKEEARERTARLARLVNAIVLAKLAPMERKVLRLYVLRLAPMVIAKRLKTSRGSVDVRLHNAVRKIANSMPDVKEKFLAAGAINLSTAEGRAQRRKLDNTFARFAKELKKFLRSNEDVVLAALRRRR